MARIYVDLINKNLRTIEDVPLRWRKEAKELLDAE
ncbi:CD1375 family protein [Bacillus horti]|uniref:Uncharacterized protein n=1 Tax=Caldalkalibacillus horti TaxID=77523 RepID=A0ABT9W089_9BACI|nr:CD1375 family protein [Bacillus horti]MDQ0166649.1 hypothetical protein [Bacillus horti]